jgi:endonuclease/exonuclease/phosphatase family metal-dependent hydrolase
MHDSFLETGKADAFGVVEGSPKARGVLKLANQASQDELDYDVGLDARAARNIAAHRLGEHGLFDTLAELDSVPWVGPRAFERLLNHALENGYVKTHIVNVATFNIRWYGLNGSFYGDLGSETRDESILAFIDEHLANVDVVVFEEIVDVERFRTLVDGRFTCWTYTSDGYKHQHVMVCTAERFRLDVEADDVNHAFEPLQDGNLRPAVHGRVHDLQTGQDVFHLLGVHLKAKPDSTERRLKQTGIIADRLEQLAAFEDALPVVVFGDFNTHWAKDTGLEQDDYLLMDAVFQERSGIDVKHVDYPAQHSFRNKWNTGYKLDRLWISSDVEVEGMSVPGPCNLDWESNQEQIVEYYEQVSDHCPVLATLAF